MIFRRAFLLLGFLTLAAVGAAASAKVRHLTPVEGVFAGAITIDTESGQVLYEQNADIVNPPASMTKLMTFAVLYDKLASGALTLQTPVQIDASDSRLGGTQVYLDPREVYPVEELIYAMMIQSANDAAHALARAAGGSVPAFVNLMNAKARELGMTHSTFRSPHGLPPDDRRLEDSDLTSPRDFAMLCRHLVQHTDVLKYTSVRTRKFGEGKRTPDRVVTMENHNKLLGKIAGVDGLKTGYTRSAGYCLSATAERNGRRIISVIMGSFGPGGQVDKGRARDLKMVELLESGFAVAPATPVAVKTTPPAPAPVAKSAAPVSAPAAAKPAAEPTITTVKTDKAAEQTSTPKEPPVVFRVITPDKKP